MSDEPEDHPGPLETLDEILAAIRALLAEGDALEVRVQRLREALDAAREEGRRQGLEEVKLLLSSRVMDLVLQAENEGPIDDYTEGLHDEAEGLLSEVAALAKTSTPPRDGVE